MVLAKWKNLADQNATSWTSAATDNLMDPMIFIEQNYKGLRYFKSADVLMMPLLQLPENEN